MTGASSGPGSRPTDGAQEVSTLTGIDPSRDELRKLRSYARRASIALMDLSGGGSEMFERLGEQFYATPELCRDRARHKAEMLDRYLSRGASAIEAGTVETEGLDAKHESATAAGGDAQPEPSS